MANSTGKAARKRYGTRFSAKQRRDSGGSKRSGGRKTFGKLPYSVLAGNAPQAAISANEALVDRINRERSSNGWEPDANVAVPGPRRK